MLRFISSQPFVLVDRNLVSRGIFAEAIFRRCASTPKGSSWTRPEFSSFGLSQCQLLTRCDIPDPVAGEVAFTHEMRTLSRIRVLVGGAFPVRFAEIKEARRCRNALPTSPQQKVAPDASAQLPTWQ